MSPLGPWREWRTGRELQARADGYAAAAAAEPPDPDVAWLAAEATGGDEDHARWELRYLSRALALVVAERLGADDLTAVAVARALARQLREDRAVAADRVAVAERQFDARLARYREALRERGIRTAAERLAWVLLGFASGRDMSTRPAPERSIAIVDGLLAAHADRLREVFGVPALPEDVAPSEALARGGR
ncbi:MAG TPA: hypothetical protein VGE02_02275 [Gemmatimonadales bacterium]